LENTWAELWVLSVFAIDCGALARDGLLKG
jgi:hypothetical protein